MNWKNVGKEIAKYAPLLGGVVGGPAGGAIGSLVASAFGVESKPEQIMQVISQDPDAALKLTEIEFNHKSELERLKFEEAKAIIGDKQHARESNKHSVMPAALSVILSLVIVGIIYLLFYTPVPPESKDVLLVILGVVVKEWGGAMQYWFGTTRSSANKDFRVK